MLDVRLTAMTISPGVMLRPVKKTGERVQNFLAPFAQERLKKCNFS